MSGTATLERSSDLLTKGEEKRIVFIYTDEWLSCCSEKHNISETELLDCIVQGVETRGKLARTIEINLKSHEEACRQIKERVKELEAERETAVIDEVIIATIISLPPLDLQLPAPDAYEIQITYVACDPEEARLIEEMFYDEADYKEPIIVSNILPRHIMIPVPPDVEPSSPPAWLAIFISGLILASLALVGYGLWRILPVFHNH